MEILSNLTLTLSLISLIVVILCIGFIFVTKYLYNNDYIKYYQWKSWLEKLFIVIFLFSVVSFLLFMAHRNFKNSVIDYNRHIEEQL
ncbi:hypothetical protein QU38_07520 [Staphylococcus aureus]|uniref:Uncharacterized protein n=1 Tax=Staphylococcus aureus TaxID=1280 RepID=A0AA40JN96_STAAU|nr:hypothetical protein QU38_07520 [Staphylococcus aureus]